MTINAYAAEAVGAELKPFTYEPGALAANHIEVEIEYCGVCHSDLSMIQNEWGFTQYPFVGGHEIVGKISAVGDDVKNLEVGQRVGVGWHAEYCLTCAQCMSGDHHLCATAVGTITGRHGGFADKVRVQAAAAVPIPESLEPEVAGPLFCGGITVFNPMLEHQLSPTARVAVIGIGGLGHMALGFLNKWGCEVTAFTSSPDKMEEAKKLGAHKTLNSRDPEEIAGAAGRFDMIISTVNVRLDWNLYVSTLAPKGVLHFVGATLEPLDVQVFPLLGGQRSISGSPVGSPQMIATMLEFAARHQIKPVVEVYPMSEINEALAHLEAGKARYRVVLKA